MLTLSAAYMPLNCQQDVGCHWYPNLQPQPHWTLHLQQIAGWVSFLQCTFKVSPSVRGTPCLAIHSFTHFFTAKCTFKSVSSCNEPRLCCPTARYAHHVACKWWGVVSSLPGGYWLRHLRCFTAIQGPLSMNCALFFFVNAHSTYHHVNNTSCQFNCL